MAPKVPDASISDVFSSFMRATKPQEGIREGAISPHLLETSPNELLEAILDVCVTPHGAHSR